jgi:hypothetical protein
MDERDMEKDGKDRKRKGWGIEKYLLRILNNPNGEEKY